VALPPKNSPPPLYVRERYRALRALNGDYEHETPSWSSAPLHAFLPPPFIERGGRRSSIADFFSRIGDSPRSARSRAVIRFLGFGFFGRPSGKEYFKKSKSLISFGPCVMPPFPWGIPTTFFCFLPRVQVMRSGPESMSPACLWWRRFFLSHAFLPSLFFF